MTWQYDEPTFMKILSLIDFIYQIADEYVSLNRFRDKEGDRILTEIEILVAECSRWIHNARASKKYRDELKNKRAELNDLRFKVLSKSMSKEIASLSFTLDDVFKTTDKELADVLEKDFGIAGRYISEPPSQTKQDDILDTLEKDLTPILSPLPFALTDAPKGDDGKLLSAIAHLYSVDK